MTSNDHASDVWDSRTVATKIGCTTKTLRRWMTDGHFPASLPRVHRFAHHRWNRCDVERWMRSRGMKVG